VIKLLDISVCRGRPRARAQDDEIKTITYDEYVNAGIPDALLQGLGFAESLSEQPMDVEDLNDAAAKVLDEQREIPGEVSVSADQPGPSIVAHAPAVPVSLIQLLSGSIADAVLPLVSRNGSELSSSHVTVGSNYRNIIPSTPAVNVVNEDGKILPNLPAVPGLVGNTEASKKVGSQAVTYVDQNGRVLARFPCQSQGGATDSSPMVRMVDSNGRVITNQLQPGKGDGVISIANISPGISGTRAACDAGSDVPMLQRLSSQDGNRSNSEYCCCSHSF